MATLFHTEQVLIGQVGKYKIVKQLQKAVWLARNQVHKDFIVKGVQNHPRVANERDVLKVFTPRSKHIRPLLDEIVDPAEPTAIVLKLEYVYRGVLEALAVMHSEGYGCIISDVKADNILVNEKPDQTNRFTDVQLADMGNSYPETHDPYGHALGHQNGHLIFRNTVSSTAVNFNIFDPRDVPTDPLDDYKFAVLGRQVEIFGPFPVKYQEIASKDVMELIVWMLENLKESRTPFQSITDIEIGRKDKNFISWIIQLDPRDRPTAAAILSHGCWRLQDRITACQLSLAVGNLNSTELSEEAVARVCE
ncbi:serine/threonine protein kinase [Diaporthe eres]|nr:serine/threonine protein kinase [Diaporthe eres]